MVGAAALPWAGRGSAQVSDQVGDKQYSHEGGRESDSDMGARHGAGQGSQSQSQSQSREERGARVRQGGRIWEQ